jgi:hypothetical protein
MDGWVTTHQQGRSMDVRMDDLVSARTVFGLESRPAATSSRSEAPTQFWTVDRSQKYCRKGKRAQAKQLWDVRHAEIN